MTHKTHPVWLWNRFRMYRRHGLTVSQALHAVWAVVTA